MSETQSTYATTTPQQPIDTCLFGYGIACGLGVYLTEDCSIVIDGGTAVLRNGTVLHVTEKRFRYYAVANSNAKDGYELVEKFTDEKTQDSLKNQFRRDTPELNFLADKIVVIWVDANLNQTFWLRSWNELVREDNLTAAIQRIAQPENPSRTRGLFGRRQPVLTFEASDIDKVLHPVRQLPDVVLPRFGYKTLAYLDKNLHNDFDNPTTKFVRLDNLRNPFGAITNYESVFDEYKAILDDGIPELERALSNLHELFGSLLTHKDSDHLRKFRQVLLYKWQVFLEQGRHLFYIQCYYDWLSDLIKAYDELREAIQEFSGECLCAEKPLSQNSVEQVRLGPVLGGQTTYKPLIFRDYFHQPFTTDQNEKRLLAIKCLHWRLMMMIWTFDLPFLQLEKNVLIDKGYLIPAEEFKDSSDYWERVFTTPTHAATFVDLPVQVTPGRSAFEPLGVQAIPYYFPLDADGPYSVHRYWDFTATYENRIDRHFSYNANPDADSYTDRQEIRFPLLYNLRDYPYFRVEGHLGKDKHVALDDAREVVQKYNLGIEVIAIDVNSKALTTDEAKGFFNLLPLTKDLYNIGLEHQPGLYAGQTWVLLFTSDEANIDLSECKRKEGTVEIKENTVVADFVLPYRFSCCHKS